MIIINEDPLLGDNISALPLIKRLVSTHPNNYIHFRNPHIASIIPSSWNLKNIYDLPTMSYNEPIAKVCIHDAVEKLGHGRFHSTTTLLKYYGYDVQEDVVRPEISFVISNQPQYDVVISVYSKANGSRMWSLSKWQNLIDKLKGKSICMVGTQYDHRPFNDISYYYGESLLDVCGVLAKAKVVVTIDNGIGRLAHAVGANHVLLCSDAVTQVWVDYPGVKMVYGSPKDFTVDQVYELISNV